MNAYPKTLQEAILFFADKDRAHAAMVELRWPEGIKCQHCGSGSHSFNAKRYVFQCRNKACRKQFTVKTGSLMEDSPIGLDKWLPAMWLVANSKNGISSCEMARALGVTQKTAWFLDHRIRLGMHQGSFDKLKGTVEVDETFIGGLARNMHKEKKALKIKGRGGVGKAIVLGLLQRKRVLGKGKKTASKIHVKVIANRQQETLHPLIREHVAEGAKLMTDEHAGYNGLEEEYKHQVINHAEAYVDGIIHTNNCENFWSLFKRAIKGTYVSVEPFHLFRYADEQAYKYNERGGNDQDRFRTLAAGIAGKRLTYKTLTGKAEDAI